MRTGRLSIGRGHGDGVPPLPAGPRLRLVSIETGTPEPEGAPAPVTQSPSPAPATLDYHSIHDRLTALERLTRLHEQGALSVEEFAAEKVAILRLPAEELVLRAEGAPSSPARIERQRGPSLLCRLLSWKFLPVGMTAGLGLSWYTQPRETLAFLEQAARYLGA
jgi:hypothetical protein